MEAMPAEQTGQIEQVEAHIAGQISGQVAVVRRVHASMVS